MTPAPLLHSYVSRVAAEAPGSVAIVAGTERWTYSRLDAESNRLAHMLSVLGCAPGDRVCFLMPRSPLAIVSVLGILKAGCIYTPLDLGSPAPRLGRILDVLEPRCLLATGTESQLDALAAQDSLAPPIRIGWLSDRAPRSESWSPAFDLARLRSCPDTRLDTTASPADPAYILFTSGSTGMPKGVVITHQSVRHFVDWAVSYFDIRAGERVSGQIPLHFDLSVFDMFGAFAAGAELHLVPPLLNLLAPKLADWIRSSRLHQWFSVPATMTHLANFDAIGAGDFPDLRRVLWCGEVLPTPTLIHWMQRLPGATFTNLYGPTETTIASSYYTVPACPVDPREAIPIGTACPGEELLVLDGELHRVPPGVVGDLYIRGAGLSLGYWRDPDQTAAAFLEDPFAGKAGGRVYRTGDLARLDEAGLCHFVGRADTQIKSRGYRIELGEIECALNALTGLRESAVVAIDSRGFEGATICCAYVPQARDAVRPVDLRRQLSRTLPAYSLPVRWKELPALPRNNNGKIDRPRLKQEFAVDGPPAN